jgi:death on curing protein
MSEPLWLEVQDICAIHGEIIAESGGDAGVLNEGALDSTANKPKNFYHYNDAVTWYELAAALGYGLAKNHCFIDGNKRIALIATYTFLSINGYEMTASEVETTRFFMELAASQESQDNDVSKITDWLRINSEPI